MAEAYFYYLAPLNDVSDKGIKKYKDLLDDVTQKNPDNTQLILLIKELIGDLEMMQKGQEAS